MKRERAAACLLAALHVLLGGVLFWRGMRMVVPGTYMQGWEWLWQVIPRADLIDRPWSSLWALHAQPPGFSFWGLCWLRLCGRVHFLDGLQWGQIVLGGLTVLATWTLARDLGGGLRVAFLAALGMAFNPALFLYEAYPLYDLLVTALLVGSVACLGMTLKGVATGGRWRGWLAAYATLLNALVLTRSLYHWLFLWAALAAAWPAWRRARLAWRLFWLTLALASPGLWYLKNDLQYGFFGPSSWFGLGLYKCVSEDVDYLDLDYLCATGRIPPCVKDHRAFFAYPDEYRPYGFVKTSDFPLLSRNDYHNMNVPDISRAYERAARAMIRWDPAHYLYNVLCNYGVFCRPPSSHAHVFKHEVMYLPWLEPFVSNVVYGTWLTDFLEMKTNFEFGSTAFVAYPLLMAWGVAWAWRRWRAEAKARVFGMDRARALLMLYVVGACVYTALIGCMFEHGEAMRFRLPTEPLTLVMVLMAARGAWRRMPEPWRRRLWPRLY
jgi:hypothetical protein